MGDTTFKINMNRIERCKYRILGNLILYLFFVEKKLSMKIISRRSGLFGSILLNLIGEKTKIAVALTVIRTTRLSELRTI